REREKEREREREKERKRERERERKADVSTIHLESLLLHSFGGKSIRSVLLPRSIFLIVSLSTSHTTCLLMGTRSQNATTISQVIFLFLFPPSPLSTRSFQSHVLSTKDINIKSDYW